ncbi:spermidine N1-acetyltransferase [Lactococcus piscium]|uniref:Spermidine N1-acetyltransferase n=1 Tax=Pseudolactococcus piscium TaxID=1364 RepID=A0A2A5RYN2_9LACT|nr:GNAT family N-acetyltransferase [Lactococcus piscium]PCS06325.1 spermidine N1-acetyltransferase [Lactococcus piscium]
MKIRPLERNDLPFIHQLDNHKMTMALWFEEPYESIDELTSLYDKHIHDNTERRFVIDLDGEFAGVIELVEIDYIHRTTEIQIIVRKAYQGQGLAKKAIRKGLDYAFNMLNMHKVYLYVDVDNQVGIHIYEGVGFVKEGMMRQQFYANGAYHDSLFMGIFKGEVRP